MPRRFVLQHLKPESPGEPEFSDPWFLNNPFKWQEALHFAGKMHATLAFLHRLEKTALWRGLPPDVRESFESGLSRERMRVALLDEEFEFSVATLARAEIPALPLKGMDLVHRFYPDRMLRPMTDVDLLVPEAQFDQAIRALKKEGYRIIGNPYADRRRIELSRYADGIAVEIHSRCLASSGEAETRALWKRAKPGGLHPQDVLLYLVRHSTVQHRLESPIWLNDLHYVIANSEIDWDLFVSEARARACTSASWFAFTLLDSGWGKSAPGATLARLRRSAGILRTHLLSKRRDAYRWFSKEPHSGIGILRARYLLADNGFQLLRHAYHRGDLGFRRRIPLAER